MLIHPTQGTLSDLSVSGDHVVQRIGLVQNSRSALIVTIAAGFPPAGRQLDMVALLDWEAAAPADKYVVPEVDE
jgi:hypothetical protein